nr:dynein regulatory complex protein 1 isoform X1 [Anolis sagrei ordinatus]XP_060610745.1 dynein regulatory complex protein 1 isoform X2 [Anolis sagrei ordinatus]
MKAASASAGEDGGVEEGAAGSEARPESEGQGSSKAGEAAAEGGASATPQRIFVPNINSDDPEERIAARRLRIAARLEAKRREALGEDPDAKKLVEEEQSRSHKQIEESRQRLAKLLLDGTELVTNIQVAADAREAHRRSEEEELTRQRVEKLENEAKGNQDKFDEITSKWASAREKVIPQDLWEALNQQQQLCALLIEEKNKLISELQQELKAKDDQYVKDLRRQAEDINLLLERMEEQIRNLMKNYRRELLQIEKAFELERRELLNNNKKKWEQGMQTLNNQELDFMMARLKKVEEYQRELNQLRVQDAEEYNVIKIKLEHDVQILEQQLEQMKAIYQLNQEKLEYNFQVLKKRDDENTIIKSQQKRKINRLHDIINNLRQKLARQVKQYREENQTLSTDYKRIVEQYKDLQRTMRHFAIVDAEHFLAVWLMNEEEAKQLIYKAFDADRVIHAQQLGLQWFEPDTWILHNVGPIVHCKKVKSANELAQEVIAAEGTSRSPREAHLPSKGSSQEEKITSCKQSGKESPEAEPAVKALCSISTKTIKHLLELLCDESGFLIESKLRGLLQPLEKADRTLMKLDSIFSALSIDNEEDVYKMMEFFLSFKSQQEMTDQDVKALLAEMTPEGEPSEEEETEAASEAEPTVIAEEATKSPVIVERASLEPLSTISMHPNDILKALKAFVQEIQKLREKHPPVKIAPEERDDSKDSEYWEALAHIIPDGKLKLWDALVVGLQKYYHILSQRAKLITETDGLHQQNAELRLLLQQYLQSPVNAELLIPPTHLLNLQLNSA